jgi:ATP-dependent DNA helicase RecG
MNLLVEYLHEVGSDLAKSAEEMSAADVARNMQIASGPAECFKPKNVGLMFFNPHPENFFRCAWIDVVDKPDPTGEGMVEQTFWGRFMCSSVRRLTTSETDFCAKRYSSTMIDQRLADSGTTPIAPSKRFLQTRSITSHIELQNPLPSW